MALTVYPVVLFNASTGSDSAASGAGPGTAVTGSAAAHTGGSSTTTITFTNSPDLSGVAQDGSHVLWLKAASGRQFSRISTVDNTAKTCVVEDSFNIAGGSPVDYAIGGKRATWDQADSRTIFASTGAKAGWRVRTETDQAITSAITVAATGSTTARLVIEGLTGTRRVVTQSASANHFILSSSNFLTFRNLKFQNSNVTKTNAYGINWAGGIVIGLLADDCVFGDATNALRIGCNLLVVTGDFFRCDFVSCTEACVGDGGASASATGRLGFFDCRFRSPGTYGLRLSTSWDTVIVRRCVIHGSGGRGIYVDNNVKGLWVDHSTIHGNAGDGIEVAAVARAERMVLVNNHFTSNGGYGVKCASGTDDVVLMCDYNNYGTGAVANTSGARSNLAAGAHDLAVDPGYANAAAGDFTPTNAALSGAAYPTTLAGSGTASYGHPGAVQPAPGGGHVGGGNLNGGLQ